MDVLAPLRGFDRFQQRHAAAGFPIAVLKKFSDDGAGNGAALIAYYGFFSIFPLLLVFVTILGFVLHGDPSAQRTVLNSTLKEFPVVGSDLGTGHAIHGSPLALVVGIVGALLSGLGVTLAAQRVFDTVYAVPRRERPDFLMSRLRGLRLLGVLGVLQVISTVVSGAVTGGLGGPGLVVGGLAISLLLNALLFLTAFRLLTERSVHTRELVPGIVMAAVLWTALQAVGGIYVTHVIKGASTTYGTFATVIGLLTWLFLGARVVVYSAEVNSVLRGHLWPRSLLDPPVPADRHVQKALALTEERDDKVTIDVSFRNPDKPPPRTPLEHEEYRARSGELPQDGGGGAGDEHHDEEGRAQPHG